VGREAGEPALRRQEGIEMADESEKKLEHEEPDVEAHKKLAFRGEGTPKAEAEKAEAEEDEAPDVEAHKLEKRVEH
jgi:hypothetical protein